MQLYKITFNFKISIERHLKNPKHFRLTTLINPMPGTNKALKNVFCVKTYLLFLCCLPFYCVCYTQEYVNKGSFMDAFLTSDIR